jgi:hypothetical protein
MTMESNSLERLVTGTMRTLKPVDVFFLFLKFRAWKKLSKEGKIPDRLRYQSASLSRLDAAGFSRILIDLSLAVPGITPLEFPIADEDLMHFLDLESTIQEMTIQQVFETFPILQSHTPFFRILPIELIQLLGSLLHLSPEDDLYLPFPNNFFEAFMLSRLFDTRVHTEAKGHTDLPDLIRVLDGPDILHSELDPCEPRNPMNEYPVSFVNLVNDTTASDSDYPDEALQSGHEPLKQTRYSIIDRLLERTTGTTVCLVPHAFLFRTVGSEKRIKRRLLEDGTLAGVISLPKNILPYSIVPTDLIVLDKSPKKDLIFFLDASASFKRIGRKNILIDPSGLTGVFRGREEKEGFSAFAASSTVADHHYNLLPTVYLQTAESRLMLERLASFETRPLNQIADIIRTTSIEGSRLLHPIPFPPQEIYREVRVSDIPEFGFIGSDSGSRRTRDLEGLIKNLLKPSDILLSIKGNVGWVGIVPDSIRGHLVANQVFLILRIKEDVIYDPIALLMYLKSDAAQALLHRVVAGSMVSTLQSKDLENIPIPLFNDEKLREIRDSFKKEIELYGTIDEIKKEIDTIRGSII